MHIPGNFNPFEFKCNYCGKAEVFTISEIEKVKVKTHGTDDACHILCTACKKGHMEPPALTMTGGIFE